MEGPGFSCDYHTISWMIILKVTDHHCEVQGLVMIVIGYHGPIILTFRA